jgi:hypothetical protein
VDRCREARNLRYAHKLLIKQDNEAAIRQRAKDNDDKQARYDEARRAHIRANKLEVEGGTGDMYKGLKKGKSGDVETKKAYDQLRFYATGEEMEGRIAHKRAEYERYAARLQQERDKEVKGGVYVPAWPFSRHKTLQNLTQSPPREEAKHGKKKLGRGGSTLKEIDQTTKLHTFERAASRPPKTRKLFVDDVVPGDDLEVPEEEKPRGKRTVYAIKSRDPELMRSDRMNDHFTARSPRDGVSGVFKPSWGAGGSPQKRAFVREAAHAGSGRKLREEELRGAEEVGLHQKMHACVMIEFASIYELKAGHVCLLHDGR